MSHPTTLRSALALAVAALIAACGGGEAPSSAAQSFTDALASTPAPARSDRLRALAAGVGGGSTAAAAGPITNDQLFAGAQAIFPSLFPASPAPTTINNLAYQGRVYTVKAYANGNYLAISTDGVVWGLGPYTNGALVQFEAVQAYADLVCANIDCGGGGTGGGGSLNGCTIGAAEALRTGNTYSAVYVSNVLVAPTSTGEYTVTGRVDGSATFEGQSVIKVSSTIKGVERGQAVDVIDTAYEQIAENDLVRSVGNEAQATFGGFNATLKTVFTPPTLNTEFTLAPGASLTKSVTSTSTTVAAGLPPLPPSTGTSTTTHTYEARETVSVLGRTYETCRYKSVTSGSDSSEYSWYIVGRGLPAKSESRTAAGTVQHRAELKSATINGAPI